MRRAVLLVSFVLMRCADPLDQPIRPIGMIRHAPLEEVSGIARSSYPGVYWVHNDGGHPARLFAVTLDGELVGRAEGIDVSDASNVDWEDIAVADGLIFIAETGNNNNERRDLGVYVVREPDPRAARRVPAVRFLPIRYPDQTAYPGDPPDFDCEALFVADGTLHFLTKHRYATKKNVWAPGTKLYRLDTDSTEDNVLTLLGADETMFLPTGADMSPDAERLAVLTYTALWVFERPAEGDNWLDGKASRVALDRGAAGVNEAVTWQDDETLIVTNEQRMIYRVRLSALSPADTRR